MNWKTSCAAAIAAMTLGVNPLSASAAELAKGEWSVRLVLKSHIGGLKDPYNVLGQRHDALPAYDKYDLPEMDQTWPGTYLSVIFYRPDWAPEDEGFNTDFHPVAPKASDEWTFEVRSDDPTRDLSLTWVGENTKMKNMELVDLQEDIVIPAVRNGQTQSYRFRMNGVVREFAWRVVSKKENKKKNKLLAASAGAAAADTAESRMAAPDQKSNWLPKGWGQGEGKGYKDTGAPDGLPADPFAE